jgi:NAD(P)-dependent dehydrogenase (short-subunit alcohol dehydrogenase family)
MGQGRGQVAIVSGGALGIGAACATALARAGAKVVVTGLDDSSEDTNVRREQCADRSAKAGLPLGKAGKRGISRKGVLFLVFDASSYIRARSC